MLRAVFLLYLYEQIIRTLYPNWAGFIWLKAFFNFCQCKYFIFINCHFDPMFSATFITYIGLAFSSVLSELLLLKPVNFRIITVRKSQPQYFNLCLIPKEAKNELNNYNKSTQD
jgi:hypothetical protein